MPPASKAYLIFPPPEFIDSDCIKARGKVKRFREICRFQKRRMIYQTEDNGAIDGLDTLFWEWYLS